MPACPELRALYLQGCFEARRFRPNLVAATRPDGEGSGEAVRQTVTQPCPRRVMITLPKTYPKIQESSGQLRSTTR
jgi:hypothetical protein